MQKFMQKMNEKGAAGGLELKSQGKSSGKDNQQVSINLANQKKNMKLITA